MLNQPLHLIVGELPVVDGPQKDWDQRPLSHVPNIGRKGICVAGKVKKAIAVSASGHEAQGSRHLLELLGVFRGRAAPVLDGAEVGWRHVHHFSECPQANTGP
jgi:hypothetical protein